MTLQNLARLNARAAANRFIGGRYLSPPDAGVILVTSDEPGCLTHLVRYVWDITPTRRTYTAWCGTSLVRGRPVDLTGEMFACARCIARADHFGASTFHLIPTTGCEASSGRRRGRRKMQPPAAR